MTKKLFLALALCVFFAFGGNAQKSEMTDSGIGVSFKALFMDYHSQNGGSFSDFKNYHRGFEVNIQKDITDNFTVVVPFKMGVVNADTIQEDVHYLRKTVYGLDLQGHYTFKSPGFLAQPYILAGVGFANEKEGELNVQIPVGAGLKVPIYGNRAFFNYQAEYRYSLKEGRNNLHHGVGFIYKLGKYDMDSDMKDKMMNENDIDGDGVENNVDLCPDVAGLKEFNGCPDRDGDGIADYQDLCPDYKGTVEMRGCPDSDGDGISDPEDKCPQEKGTAANEGCPEGNSQDRDGDGILNSIDKCPDEAGPLKNEGCPEAKVVNIDKDGDGIVDEKDNCPNIPGTLRNNGCPESAESRDSDGDGVPDKDDRCPNSVGPKVYSGCPDTDGDGLHDGRDACPNSRGSVANNGCPEVTKEDRETLDIAMRAVQFDSGRATLKAESYGVLSRVYDILLKYPDYNLSIEGHTDNTGSASNNQKLSERRAKACYEYLTQKGISSRRLSFAGYGETRPVSDNSTLRGRTLNRRVEFKMVTPR